MTNNKSAQEQTRGFGDIICDISMAAKAIRNEVDKQQSFSGLLPAAQAASEYRMIKQGSGVNELVKQRTPKRQMVLDINGSATIETDENGFGMQIKDFAEYAGWRTSTAQLFDALTIAATANGMQSPAIMLSQREYMQWRGLKDWKRTKEQISEDLETLTSTYIKFPYKKNGKLCATEGYMNIVAKAKPPKNGIIECEFTAPFFSIMKSSYNVMPYHMLAQRLSGDCYNLFRKMLEHKNMNIGRANENIMSVRTLLSVQTETPSYEGVKQKGRQVRQRIIDPFERNLCALSEALTWHYCHAHGVPVTDDELQNMTYTAFSRLNVLITWVDYPDQTQRLERKAAKIEAAKRRSRAKKPKAETEA